ncbi:hypothetical protein DOY81_010967, partial [Sarcophaga bullata]
LAIRITFLFFFLLNSPSNIRSCNQTGTKSINCHLPILWSL